jgi:hypothetical protein
MNMEQDENDAVIVRSTIDLGRNLGLSVIARCGEQGDLARSRPARLRPCAGLLPEPANLRASAPEWAGKRADASSLDPSGSDRRASAHAVDRLREIAECAGGSPSRFDTQRPPWGWNAARWRRSGHLRRSCTEGAARSSAPLPSTRKSTPASSSAAVWDTPASTCARGAPLALQGRDDSEKLSTGEAVRSPRRRRWRRRGERVREHAIEWAWRCYGVSAAQRPPKSPCSSG